LAGAGQKLGVRAEAVEIERGALRGDLLEALVIGIVEEA
jgi:hypothetical protein